jgi:hypothetical protein
MRVIPALGPFITLRGSASAATLHHSGHHVIARASHGYVFPGLTYAAPRPHGGYDDTPRYDDPSKFGGDAALSATPRGFKSRPHRSANCFRESGRTFLLRLLLEGSDHRLAASL